MGLRAHIINYLDDKASVTLIKQESSIARTNMVQTLDTRDQGEQGEDEEMKNEDLCPAVPERQRQIYGQRKQGRMLELQRRRSFQRRLSE